MAFSHTITGATDRSSIVRGDVGFVSGIYIGGGLATGTIVTGGGTVIAFGITKGTISSAASSEITARANFNGLAGTAVGSIGVLQMAADGRGEWWAIVQQ